jgi:hypothetical protein
MNFRKLNQRIRKIETRLMPKRTGPDVRILFINATREVVSTLRGGDDGPVWQHLVKPVPVERYQAEGVNSEQGPDLPVQ